MSGVLRVVNVSGGSASAVALLRVLERYGRDSVKAIFADTMTEDADLYRFLDDLERVSGVEIERIASGVDIWDVFLREAMFTNPQTGGCIASHRLKKVPLRQHLERIGAAPGTTFIYVGFDPTEDDRQARLRYAGAPWEFDFPLCWSPPLFRCDQADYLRRRGLTPCSMYDRGYSHANCGGTCVLAGIGQWSMVLKDYPERYAKAEQVERDAMAKMVEAGREPHTILRSRVGGVSRNLSLSELRRQIEAGERPGGDEERLGSCSCVGLLFDL